MNRPEIITELNGFSYGRADFAISDADFAALQTWRLQFAEKREFLGNLKYNYYLPFDGGDELLLVEKWRDAEALAAHAKTPHFLRLGALKTAYVTETVIEKYVPLG